MQIEIYKNNKQILIIKFIIIITLQIIINKIQINIDNL